MCLCVFVCSCAFVLVWSRSVVFVGARVCLRVVLFVCGGVFVCVCVCLCVCVRADSKCEKINNVRLTSHMIPSKLSKLCGGMQGFYEPKAPSPPPPTLNKSCGKSKDSMNDNPQGPLKTEQTMQEHERVY